MEQLWTKKDLAKYLQWSSVTVDSLVKKNEIPFIRISRSIRFEPDKIREYVKKNTVRIDRLM